MDPNHILTTLKEHLLHSQLFNSGNSAGFKVVCDLLISCSTGRYLPGDLVQSHAFSIMVSINDLIYNSLIQRRKVVSALYIQGYIYI